MTATTPTSPTHADRGPRDFRALALQLLRLPAALTLVVLVAPPQGDLLQAIGLIRGPVTYTTMWLRIVLVAFAFMLVVTLGRRRHAPIPLLLVEVAIAATLGFTPPYLWGPWQSYHPFSFAMGFEFVAPLAIAWFAVCLVSLLRQWRQQRGVGAADGLPAASLSARPAAWLPWLRVPALIGMLLLVATHRERLNAAWAGAGTFELVWVPLTLAVLAFMAIAVAGRRRGPWPLRGGELVLAGVLGFTPKFQWYGLLDWSELAYAFAFEFTAPLAIAWFTVALVSALEGLGATRRAVGTS